MQANSAVQSVRQRNCHGDRYYIACRLRSQAAGHGTQNSLFGAVPTAPQQRWISADIGGYLAARRTFTGVQPSPI